MNEQIIIATNRQGLYEITQPVQAVLDKHHVDNGLCTLFILHTSASLIIQENADPKALYDLEQWLNRMVPSNQPQFTHTEEGPDDMPSHIKSVLTATHLSIPIMEGRLTLGTWQGVFLWEHRHQSYQRKIIVHLGQ